MTAGGRTRRIAVVGAGMGGLAAALDLAARGYEVTLFEAAATVGGKMRAPTIGGRAVDSGPTVFTMRWIFDALFEHAGMALEEGLSLTRAERLARHAWADGGRLDLFSDLEASCAAIETFSGLRDADAYRQFVADSGRIFDTLDHSFMRATRPTPVQLGARVGWHRLHDLWATRPFVSLYRDLKRRFNDPRLVQLFGRYATYCGSSPFRAPATLALIAEAERRGVWYVQGGMQQLAQAMAARFEALGGTLALATPVEAIVATGQRIQRVQPRGAAAWVGDAVIFAGDTQALADGHLGDAVRTAAPQRRDTDFSLSAVTLAGPARWQGLALSHHTVLFSADYAAEFAALLDERRAAPDPTIYLCAPNAVGGASDRGEGSLFALANAAPGPLSATVCDDIEQSLRAQLERFGLKVQWQQVERTDPNDFAHMFPGSRGALYGRSTHGPFGSFARSGARSKRAGLYLAGASVHPGAGIPMATQSGRLAAAAVAEDIPL